MLLASTTSGNMRSRPSPAVNACCAHRHHLLLQVLLLAPFPHPSLLETYSRYGIYLYVCQGAAGFHNFWEHAQLGCSRLCAEVDSDGL